MTLEEFIANCNEKEIESYEIYHEIRAMKEEIEWFFLETASNIRKLPKEDQKKAREIFRESRINKYLEHLNDCFREV